VRDFRAMAAGAGIEVRRVVKDSLDPMVAAAKRQAPGTGVTIGGPWRSQMSGDSGKIENTHPGAGPHEFGGTIAPRGVPITFEKAHMVYGPGGALEATKGDMIGGLIAGFERLARRHGW